jgi:tetratricopeptide (TPR) repeat protein
LQRLAGSLAAAGIEAGLPSDPVVQHLLGRLAASADAAVAADLDAQIPEIRRMRYLAALERLVRDLARERALIVVLEDLHWADASSIDALIRLLPAIAAHPTLLLATTRPDIETDGWRLVEAAHGSLPPDAFEQISLGPLTEADTRHLVSNLLEIDALPDQIRDRILAHADGNPFFVEETVRMLLERGAIVQRDGHWVATESITRVEIPRTIHSLLLARIDRLPADPRRALRVGSVVGREFGAGLLRDVQGRAGLSQATDEHLAALQASGLVRTRADGAQIVLRFRHALVQEAAYDSLLRAERGTLHRAVAEALEANADPQTLTDLAATISEHFEAAGASDRAYIYGRRAAEAAFARYALPEAVAQYRRAIRLADAAEVSPADRRELWLRAGRAIELMDRYTDATEHYTTLLDASRIAGDRPTELAALTARSISRSMTVSSWHDLQPAQADAAEALELARALGDRESEATVWWALMLAHRSYAEAGDEGPRYGLEAIARSDELGLERLAALARQDVARSYDATGRFREALELLDGSIPYWRRVNDLPALADGLRLRSGVLWLLGELDEALAAVGEARTLDETTRNAFGRCFDRIQRGGLLADMTRFDEALADLRESIEIGDATEVSLLRLAPRASTVVVLLETGDIDGARTLWADFVARAEGAPPPMVMLGHSVEAWIETAAGRLEDARDALDLAGPPEIGLFGFGGLRFWEGAVLAGLALGRHAEALERVDAVLSFIVPARARLWEADARWLRARALVALGDHAEAEQELRLALATADAVGLRLHRDEIARMLGDLAPAPR